MASYPTSVISFTTKNSGDTIQAAHVNSVQDEVAAVEDGLKNGLAHAVTISTGGLTVSTGNVSFGQNLSVAGTSTFASRPVMPPPDAIRLSGSTTALANDSTTAVTWPTQDFAINSSLHSTGTNPQRLTPQSTGVYCLNAIVKLAASFTAGSTQTFDGRIEDSSGGVLAYQVVGGMDSAPTVSVTALKRFDSVAGSTQWLRVVARHRSASTNSLDGSFSFCQFWKL